MNSNTMSYPGMAFITEGEHCWALVLVHLGAKVWVVVLNTAGPYVSERER